MACGVGQLEHNDFIWRISGRVLRCDDSIDARTTGNDATRRHGSDQILEELRLNTEDLHELAKQAVERAQRMVADVRATRLWAAQERARLKALEKA